MAAKGAGNLANLPKGFGIEWTTRTTFRLEGHEFVIPNSMNDFVAHGGDELDGKLYLSKTAPIISRYLVQVRGRKPSRILELGVYRGGSAAFLQLIARPQRMLALELAETPPPALEKFIEKEGLQKSMRLICGVDQADRERVRALVAEHLGEGRSVDLVVDDASHLLGPTRASFETVFPYIRDGGSYVIEDYASSQILCNEYLDRAMQGEQGFVTMMKEGMRGGLQSDHKPLHLLAIELMLASIMAPGIVNKVILDRHWIRVIRGSKPIEEPEHFRLADYAGDYFGLLDAVPAEQLKPFLSP